jgi:hypothetical protein
MREVSAQERQPIGDQPICMSQRQLLPSQRHRTLVDERLQQPVSDVRLSFSSPGAWIALYTSHLYIDHCIMRIQYASIKCTFSKTSHHKRINLVMLAQKKLMLKPIFWFPFACNRQNAWDTSPCRGTWYDTGRYPAHLVKGTLIHRTA